MLDAITGNTIFTEDGKHNYMNYEKILYHLSSLLVRGTTNTDNEDEICKIIISIFRRNKAFQKLMRSTYTNIAFSAIALAELEVTIIKSLPIALEVNDKVINELEKELTLLKPDNEYDDFSYKSEQYKDKSLLLKQLKGLQKHGKNHHIKHNIPENINDIIYHSSNTANNLILTLIMLRKYLGLSDTILYTLVESKYMDTLLKSNIYCKLLQDIHIFINTNDISNINQYDTIFITMSGNYSVNNVIGKMIMLFILSLRYNVAVPKITLFSTSSYNTLTLTNKVFLDHKEFNHLIRFMNNELFNTYPNTHVEYRNIIPILSDNKNKKYCIINFTYLIYKVNNIEKNRRLFDNIQNVYIIDNSDHFFAYDEDTKYKCGEALLEVLNKLRNPIFGGEHDKEKS